MKLIDPKKGITRARLQSPTITKIASNKEIILCNHCKRTASNGIRCLGMCVADNDYWNI